jgi:hypothetical protein
MEIESFAFATSRIRVMSRYVGGVSCHREVTESLDITKISTAYLASITSCLEELEATKIRVTLNEVALLTMDPLHVTKYFSTASNLEIFPIGYLCTTICTRFLGLDPPFLPRYYNKVMQIRYSQVSVWKFKSFAFRQMLKSELSLSGLR